MLIAILCTHTGGGVINY